MARTSRRQGLGRQSEPGVLILTSLASGPKHGYALLKDIERFAGTTLGPGTLYGAISRLEARGFIRPTAGDARRQPYEITALGRRALEEAAAEMRTVAAEAASRLATTVRATTKFRWAP